MVKENQKNEGIFNRPPSVVLVADFGDQSATTQCALAVENAFAQVDPTRQLPHFYPVDDLVAYDQIGCAFALDRQSQRAAAGTIFFAVVDPGVGTDRELVAVTTANNSVFIGPNTGVLWPSVRRQGIRAVHFIDYSRFGDGVTSTFHGRDIMAPLAGYLAGGRSVGDYGTEAGEETLERLRVPYGRVLWVDPNFGNIKIWSGIPEGAQVLLFTNGTAYTHSAPVVNTFGDVPIDHPLAYEGSDRVLEIAINKGNAAGSFGIRPQQILTLGWR